METPLIWTLPLICLLAAFAYAAVVGERLHSSTGAISVLGVAATLVGLTAGWLLQRFVPLVSGADEGDSYGGLRLGVALLFALVSAVAVLAVFLIRRDLSGRSKLDSGRRKCGFLAALFVLAMGIPARAKLAACIALLLAKGRP